MEQFKRAQIIMLPTDTKSLLHINYSKLQLNKFEQLDTNNQYLYIISDDKIKEGDWYIELDINSLPLSIKKAEYNKTNEFSLKPYSDYCKKIIATTDTSLKIEIDGNRGDLLPDVSFDIDLPQPSQQFITKYIESYNKGEIITDILVEYNEFLRWDNSTSARYVELEINPKDNTITIKKVKDSWNREELINIIKKVYYDAEVSNCGDTVDKWIKENL